MCVSSLFDSVEEMIEWKERRRLVREAQWFVRSFTGGPYIHRVSTLAFQPPSRRVPLCLELKVNSAT